ncbi:hypothetical protein Nepgr_020179 [Nepenthes gracilis]|uniref:Uncharacterized protein n=1 Tax=Nepenthes gracilis TaxID=150966 RepID=A0AAD3SVH2_NEPGR|nr:hypothetical protein Nepgr_020179 [Nepenthes gracilis]
MYGIQTSRASTHADSTAALRSSYTAFSQPSYAVQLSHAPETATMRVALDWRMRRWPVSTSGKRYRTVTAAAPPPSSSRPAPSFISPRSLTAFSPDVLSPPFFVPFLPVCVCVSLFMLFSDTLPS